jgi:hypothetical protein
MSRKPAAQPRSHHNLNVRIPIGLIERLRKRAEREHNGVSAVARRLLTMGLREESASEVKRRA